MSYQRTNRKVYYEDQEMDWTKSSIDLSFPEIKKIQFEKSYIKSRFIDKLNPVEGQIKIFEG